MRLTRKQWDVHRFATYIVILVTKYCQKLQHVHRTMIVKLGGYMKGRFINNIIQKKRVNLEVVQGFSHAKR